MGALFTFIDIRDFLAYHRCKLECEKDHANVWRKPSGDYITFFSDDLSATNFVLKRILEQLGKDISDFNLFMEAKHGKPFNGLEHKNHSASKAEFMVEVTKTLKEDLN